MSRRVPAQGPFELLHPGHVHYLREPATFGDTLYVIIAHRRNVDHEGRPVITERHARRISGQPRNSGP